ncbi:23S rRNA (Uracil-5-)-methyltransferase [Striga asiatica]|uniref:23S rRNA (Uracil-5-)-methyltransferase n=1 Tax=Striga asiatica TaxID=4170 RepID=A0A5A7QEC5_STRAF|nr:23S rRNA (Uracil-5-)-methyltransferase [Striga asiatica]
MLERVDMGMTTKSSITMYITTPFTNPPFQTRRHTFHNRWGHERNTQTGEWVSGFQKCVFGLVGLHVGLVQVFYAVVEIPQRANHSLFAHQVDDIGHRQREYVEEKIDRVLAGLSEQDAFGFGVDEELHAYRGFRHLYLFVSG